MSWWPEPWTFHLVQTFVFLEPWWPESWTLLAASILVCVSVTVVGIVFTLKARDDRVQKLIREILWATLAAYAVVSVADAYVSLRSSAQPTLWNFAIDKMPTAVVWVFFLFLLFYWGIPLLILSRYKNDLYKRWHVWGMWTCTTVFMTWELLTHRKVDALILVGGFVSAPIITALGGVIIGEALFRLQNALAISRLNFVARNSKGVFVSSFLVFMLVSLAFISFEILNEPELPPNAITNAVVRYGKLPRVVQDEAIIKCPNPSDTLLYINIITGRLNEKASAFNSDQKKCSFDRDTARVFFRGDRVIVDGVELLCLKGWEPGICYWALAAEIELDPAGHRLWRWR